MAEFYSKQLRQNVMRGMQYNARIISDELLSEVQKRFERNKHKANLELSILPDKTIVANVDATGYQNARIYSAEEIVFDDDYIKSFADKLFSGSYEVKKPI